MNYLDMLKKLSIETKYFIWYSNLMIKARLRGNDRISIKHEIGYIESHHILPKSFKMGGEKDSDNLVFLTAREHFIAHCFLIKMLKDGKYKQKMAFSLQRMKQSNNTQLDRYFNSYLFEYFRKNKPKFLRLYMEDKVKYINFEDIDLIYSLKSNGWSDIMTDEYKVGRVGMMKGKKHSEETKQKQSKSNPKMWKGKTLSKSHRENISKNAKGKIIISDEEKAARSLRAKELHNKGILNSKGDNNPNSKKRRGA